MNEELAVKNKVVIGPKYGLAKKVAESQNIAVAQDFSTYPNRLGIVMDDSGSMCYSMDKAHLAVDTFIKNCNATDTALCLYPLNAPSKSLTNIFAAIGIYVQTVEATGGTPLYQKLL